MTDKGPAGKSTHQFTQVWHPWKGFVVVLFRILQEHVKVLLVDLVKLGHIHGQGGPSEETVKTLAIFDVLLSIQKYPIGFAQQFVRTVNDAWLDIGRGIENFSSHITGGGNDDESAD